MDKQYKSLFLKNVKALMRQRLNSFSLIKVDASNALKDIFAGDLLYRKAVSKDRFVWIVWSADSGIARSFTVSLGWTFGQDNLPAPGYHCRELLRARQAIPGLVGGCIDLELVEGSNSSGGIEFPSPWDQLSKVSLSASKSVEREVMMKAMKEADLLTEDDRLAVVVEVLARVIDRLEHQLPSFIGSILNLPAPTFGP